MDTSRLEAQFDTAMMEIYQRAKIEANYVATVFHRMLSDHRGLETARRLVNDRKVSDGYTALWERGRLDLTVEAVIWDNPKWHPLFTPNEMKVIEKRLSEYGYLQ